MPNKKLTNSKTVKKQVKKPVKPPVNHRKIILTGMAVLALLLAFLPWQYVFAATPVLLVDPYENISTVGDENGVTYLNVSGAELVPNAVISVEQRSFSPLSEADGGGNEYEFYQSLTVGADGKLSAKVPVRYDVSTGGSLSTCNTVEAERKACYLEFRYESGTFTNGSLLYIQNLYFGMPGPITAPLAKDDCKADKWKNFAALGIKNQGDCVSYVASKQ